MMTPLWEFADSLGVVPMEPDARLRQRIEEWWGQPIRRGCRHRGGSILFVTYPDLHLLCGVCALDALRATAECIYCGGKDVDEAGQKVVTEGAAGLVVMFARAHTDCTEASR